MTLEVGGASESELARGLAAAAALFEARGISALQAVTAYNIVRSQGEAMNHSAFAATDQQIRDHWIWHDAEEAAIAACCAGWNAKQRGAALVMKWADDVVAEDSLVDDG